MQGAGAQLRFPAQPIYHTSHLQSASHLFMAKLKNKNAKRKMKNVLLTSLFAISHF
jgi:hypothetical protein